MLYNNYIGTIEITKTKFSTNLKLKLLIVYGIILTNHFRGTLYAGMAIPIMNTVCFNILFYMKAPDL